MDPQLERQLLSEARNYGLTVSPVALQRLDQYAERFFRYKPEKDKLVIETYLGQAALRIAKAEGKSIVEADDVKAAVWLFHLPEHPDDPCGAAGERALNEEKKRGVYLRGILTESFRDFLNRQ
jgi:hypothetical protein